MRLLVRDGTLLTMVPGAAPATGGVAIEDGRIVAIGETPGAFNETIDAAGCYVLPGLVQTHVHLVQTLFRGLAEDLPLLRWLRERVWPLEAAHDERSLRAGVRMGLLELLRTGTTTVLDMGTTHGGDVVAEELVASGIRARFGQAMMDAGDGVPPRLRETTRASLDAGAALRGRWDGAGEGRIGYAYAPRFALSCTREILETVAQRAANEGALVHTHSNEDRDERAAIVAATGRPPALYLDDVGLIGDRSVIAHGVHVDADELRVLASRGAAVTHCPSSNLKLGSGIADVVRLREAGVCVAIGADGAACNNRLDAFGEVRLAALLARSLHGADAFTADDALRLATRDGARALRLENEIGTLEVGKRADLIVLDTGSLDPGGDPATRIVFGGGSRAVRDVVVEGRVLVRGGAPVHMDAAEVRARAAEAQRELVARAGI
ncbi:MAG: amidohydrolase family protein [Chloroflexota bacterium]|nr:amidohydrolase family protein [Chloroflexota bacterium]